MDFTRPTSGLERRVVVTGIGIVSPLGLTTNESWNNLTSGVSGVGPITAFDTTHFDCKIAGEVKNFNPENFIPKKEVKKMDRFIQLAIAAGDEAIKDSGFEINDTNRESIGCFIGVGMGGLPAIENQHKVFFERGPNRVTPFFIPMIIANMAAGYFSIQYKLKGPSYCNTSACASGAHAIGEAVQYIRRGLADVMIAGGSESTVTALAIAGFSNMKALSCRNENPKIASRPFDKDRDGFVLGEGSSILVLESLENAVRRGAKIYAEITGYGCSSDGYHMTSPAPEHEGAQRAMRSALADARLSPDSIDYLNAHGTSTPIGDELETIAVKRVFKDHSKKIMVSSTKSMTGHLLGAAGALESAICCLSIYHGIVAPTINLDTPSPECDLDYVPLVARQSKITHAVNNSFGFGGTNATVVFSKI